MKHVIIKKTFSGQTTSEYSLIQLILNSFPVLVSPNLKLGLYTQNSFEVKNLLPGMKIVEMSVAEITNQ